jgi:pimeloyl-ACP methyl ester carboxylesterase
MCQVYFSYFRDQAARDIEQDVKRFLMLTERGSQPEDRLSLFKSLTALTLTSSLPIQVKRSRILTEAELDWMVQMWGWTGAKYALLWYANTRRNNQQTMKTESELGLPPLPSSSPPSTPLIERITVPALMMPAECDPVLKPELSDGMERWCDDFSRVDIKKSSHWSLLEQPEQVNTALTAFIERIRLKQVTSK